MKPNIAVVLFVLLTVAANEAAQNAAPPKPELPRVFDTRTHRIRVVEVVSGLAHPWSLAFLPDGSMLVTERPGRLRIIRNGVLEPQPIAGIPSMPAEGSAGLHGLAVHPDFAQNRLVYFSYAKAGEKGTTLAVGRGRLDGNQLNDVRDIFVAEAWETSGNLSGRIMFAPDRTLYVTVGDRDRLCCVGSEDNSLRMRAQDLGNHVGKTLRLRDDGTAPADNPFVGRPGARPEIFTYGHRNGYGLAVHPETGAVWQVEIGPLGGDEANILLPGRNYGWPLVSLGRNYTGTLVSEQPWWRPDMEMPRIAWIPSVSPSGLVFYTGDRFPEWKGNLFLGSLTARHLQRIAFNQPSQAERREPLLGELRLRVRDVQQGPDGYLYVTTETQNAGNRLDGSILRIEPAPAQTDRGGARDPLASVGARQEVARRD